MGATEILSTQNQAITNYDFSKLFLTTFKTVELTYTNVSGGTVELLPGMLFGQVSADLKAAILKSASIDGSQIPFGVLVTQATVLDTASKVVQIAVTGMVDQSLLLLDGADTLNTLIDGRTIAARIPADTEGITLESFEELVNQDNQ